MLTYFKDWDNAAEIGMQYMKCVIGILFKNNGIKGILFSGFKGLVSQAFQFESLEMPFSHTITKLIWVRGVTGV